MIEYKKLGFKCGLEIHQQLETNKLFCNCPPIVHDENPKIFFKRKLRAVAGETGEVDLAAAFEQNKDKIFNYQACPDSSCLVEFDEEPPHHVNQEALETALEIALLLNCKIIDQIHFMRKTVIDGSNVSGFQRTALVGVDGHIETSKGKVSIPTVCLEEEAAKKVDAEKNKVTYRLDRLGVPLIEIATGPEIKDAAHAKESASILGMILRSTGKVKRGIGSIRQDVNVSIKDKSRVEIKGFQDLKSIPLVIENEVKRQESLNNPKPEVRKAEQDGSTSYLRPMPGAARMYPETDIRPIEISQTMLKKIELPELIAEKSMKLEKKFGLNADQANEIIKEEIDFEGYTASFKNIEPKLLATILTVYPKELKSRYGIENPKISHEAYSEILRLLDKGEISKEAVIELMADAAQGKKIDASRFKSISEAQLKKELEKIVNENKDAPINALMGEAMKRFRGKAEGKRIMEILKTLI